MSLCFAGWIPFTVYDHQGYMDLFVLLPFLAIIVGATLDRWVSETGKADLGPGGSGGGVTGFWII